ncbi:MAG: Rid family detoxifying hydrolase [Candidatus Limnocylindrales bacterium]
MSHERIQTSGAPAAIGPYSQAIRAGEFLFCAGQVGLDPATGALAGSFEDQVERALDNVAAVLAAAGLGFPDVIKTTCFLVDLGDFQVFNERYGRRFGESVPARSTVAVAGLPRGARVEIEVIAHRASLVPAVARG